MLNLQKARRSAWTAAISLIAFMVTVVAVPNAQAQSAEAESLFNEGDKLMSEGKIAEACDAFEASNRSEPRAGTLIRLGECREQNHQVASAWAAYKDALTRVKDPVKREIALAKSLELEPKLSYLTITIASDARVAGLAITRNQESIDPMLWNRAMPVDGGVYVISARATGADEWSTKLSIPETAGKVTVDIPKLSRLREPTTPIVTLRSSNAPERPLLTSKRKLALGLAAGGALAVVSGIVLGTAANNRRDEARALCPDPKVPCADAGRATDLSSAGHSRAIGANVAFGISAAAAIGAGVLWFIGKPEAAQRVAITPTASGFAVIGEF